MRRFLLAAVAALMLAIPAAALGDQLAPPAPGAGSLVVQNGRGIVYVAAKGGIIGRFDSGQITIEDPVEGDGKPPIVFGAEKLRPLGAHKMMYIGNDVHFYVGGLYRVKVVATGINLSAVGKGTATLSSTGFLDPGFYRVDGGPPVPLPDSTVKVTLGSG
jgi:hypothetical protein